MTMDHLSTLEGNVGAALEAARRAHERLARSAAELTAGAEERVTAALRAREAALSDLGRAVLAWTAAGGAIEVIDPPPVAAPVEVAPISKPPPASPAALVALQARLRGGAADSFAPDPTPAVLAEVLRRLGPPPPLADLPERAAEVRRLREVIDAADPEWDVLPVQTQRELLQLCAARARRVQDGPVPFAPWEALDGLFSEMTRYSAQKRPGTVRGLSLRHKVPEEGWAALAEACWERLGGGGEEVSRPNRERALDELRVLTDDEALDGERLCAAAVRCLDAGVESSDPRLVALLAPWVELLTGEPRLRAARKAARDFAAAEEECGEAADGERWRFAGATEGKRAILVGGDRTSRLIPRLADHFGFVDVDWESGRSPRRVDALCARVENGGFDYLILLTAYMSHKTAGRIEAAVGSTDTLRVVVERGYGLGRIAAAMERALTEAQED